MLLFPVRFYSLSLRREDLEINKINSLIPNGQDTYIYSSAAMGISRLSLDLEAKIYSVASICKLKGTLTCNNSLLQVKFVSSIQTHC